MLKNIFKIGNLKYVVAFLLPLVIILLYRRTLDNDTWFVLAEGRHILEKGIYYNDVLSMHDGLEIVVQQYGFAVIFWLIYSVFGSIGLYVMTILFNFLRFIDETQTDIENLECLDYGIHHHHRNSYIPLN